MRDNAISPSISIKMTVYMYSYSKSTLITKLLVDIVAYSILRITYDKNIYVKNSAILIPTVYVSIINLYV